VSSLTVRAAEDIEFRPSAQREGTIVATTERTHAERILAERDRYVARGIAPSPIVVARAEGARVWDVDGRGYVDFAGGIGCQNTGHGFAPVVAAIHEQADRFLHQCFMVGAYEPYVEVCRRLAALSPCGSGEQRSILVNSGAEAVENAVKIARAATARPAVLVFENAFHGRTLLTMTMTAKLVYKKGFGPFAPEIYRAPSPYPYRGVSSDDALDRLADLFLSEVDPASVACAVLEPVQGEGGFVTMPEDFPARLKELLASHGILYVDDEVQSGVGRTGPVWAIEHYGVEPDLIVSGKSLGGGLPLAGVTGRAEVMDSVPAGGLGGTFGGNPLSCAAAAVVLDEVASSAFRSRADALGAQLRARLDEIAARVPTIGEVRGLGPMLALELVSDRTTKEPAADIAKRTVDLARERGLILLACGLHGNVVRLLPPVIEAEDEIEEGLAILEGALVDTSAGAP
jgi:4-aminobutyrate aminotransferase/(S)-3-amino-2-methylpropionate transaminase